MVRRGRPDLERDARHRHLSGVQPDDDRPHHESTGGRQRRRHDLQGRVARAAHHGLAVRSQRGSGCSCLLAARHPPGRRCHPRLGHLPDQLRLDQCRHGRRLRQHHAGRLGWHQSGQRHQRRHWQQHVQLERQRIAERHLLGARDGAQRQQLRLVVLDGAGAHRETTAAHAELLRAVEPGAVSSTPAPVRVATSPGWPQRP